jgi:nucleotide-binding universal stress UspA family protein
MGYPPAPSLIVETGDVSAETSPVAAGFDRDCVLVPLLTPTEPIVTGQLRVATALSRTSGAPLYVVDPTEATPTEYDPGLPDDTERELAARAARTVSRAGPPGLLRTRTLLNRILTEIRATDDAALVVPSGAETGFLRRNLTERLGIRANCEVVTVNGCQPDDARSILVAVTGGPHSAAAADVAGRIAADTDAWVDVLHVVPPDATDRQRAEADTYVEAACGRIGRPDRTTGWVLDAPDAAEAIVEQSEYYGLTVIGAPTKGRLRELIAGSTPRTVRDGARSPVISVRCDQ